MAQTLPKLPIELPMEALTAFCKKWKVRELALFGSILREDFRPDSDVDFLFSLQEGAGGTLWDLVDMEEELVRILGRPVDLVERRAVEQRRNYIRREEIRHAPLTIYAA